MTGFRFVHTADIHLDSPLRSLALRNPDLRELVSNATRQAFESLISLCLAEKVDALLIAGDLYDGDQTSMKTARFLAQQLKRLHEAGIRSYIIRGNHDAVSKITRELTFEDSVKVFGAHPEAAAFERGGSGTPVHIHGLSFAQPHAPDSLLKRYGAKIDGGINIGLLHTSLGGAEGHDVYSPCQPGELHATGFDYWGLGHIHKRSALEGAARIVMPGMPQGRDIGEAGAKSVSLVTIAGDGAISIEERLTSVAQFERVGVDLSGIAEWREAHGRIRQALENARAAAPSEQLIANLMLSGDTPLAWQLRRDFDRVRAEAEQGAEAVGKTWIDRISIDCAMPDGAAASSADKISELQRLIEEEVIGSPAYAAEIDRLVEEFEGQLPAEIRDAVLPRDAAGRHAGLEAMAHEGALDVLARLAGERREDAS